MFCADLNLLVASRTAHRDGRLTSNLPLSADGPEVIWYHFLFRFEELAVENEDWFNHAVDIGGGRCEAM
jgi:hypothetical protein